MTSLIIVSGPSASGKSTLAGRLAADLRLPLMSRDRIKEALFDTLGYSDRQRSKALGAAAALVLLREAEDILMANVSCIIEAKFNPKFSETELAQLLTDTGATAMQIQCYCDGKTLYERFKQRIPPPDRHPGHDEAHSFEGFTDELLAGKLPHLQIDGTVLEYDTTFQEESRYQELLQKVQAKLAHEQ